jgi:transcriptional regulator with XRE-family HTH domain
MVKKAGFIQIFGTNVLEKGDIMAVGKYDTHVKPKLLLIEAWCRDGLTLEQIADNLGIAKSTLCEYQKIYSDLSDSLKSGREVIDVMVENALLKAALGYEYEEETATKEGIEKLRKVAHPNTTALIFWLKNRRSAAWRDKQDIEVKSEVVNRHEYHITQTIQNDPEAAEALRTLYRRSASSAIETVGNTSRA